MARQMQQQQQRHFAEGKRQPQRVQSQVDAWSNKEASTNDKDADEDDAKRVVDPALWSVQDAEALLQHFRKLATQERRDRLRRQQQLSSDAPGPDACAINQDYVEKSEAIQQNVFNLAQDVIFDTTSEIKKASKQNSKLLADLKEQYSRDKEDIRLQYEQALTEQRRQHAEALAEQKRQHDLTMAKMDRLEQICNATQVH